MVNRILKEGGQHLNNVAPLSYVMSTAFIPDNFCGTQRMRIYVQVNLSIKASTILRDSTEVTW
jgi:hypothetical protein